MWREVFLGLVACAWLCLVNVDADTLLMVNAVWRHGDRTPLGTYPKDPNRKRFPQGFGKLTKTGAKQHKKLGKWLRERYVTNLQFLPSKLKSKYVYAQSTDYSRTLKSAKNNFRGMYGKVPKIKVVSKKSDISLAPLSSCKRAIQFNKLIKQTDTYKQYSSSKKPLFDRLRKLTGTKQSFSVMSKLQDTIFVEKKKGMSIPKAIKNLFPQIDEAATRYRSMSYGYNMGNYSGYNLEIEIPRALGGSWLQKVIQSMDQKLKNSTELKYLAYSAHDSTLLSILSTFGFNFFNYDKESIPPYATVLLVELWQNTTSYVPYVQVFYKQGTNVTDLSAQISGCNVTTSGCTFEQFRTRSAPYLPNGSAKSFCKQLP
ncbi:putative esophageal gland cell secretory protein 21 [Aphelenchoides bicaudatus]|nr:putative esophageal gland cell secretory protein 21 [Aphelenchoides bicaudatus]